MRNHLGAEACATSNQWLMPLHCLQVLHGAERAEPAALLLSPLRPSFKSPSRVDVSLSGDQFTFFLTSPLQAFCNLVGLPFSDRDTDVYDAADNIISNSFSKWEVILCTSTSLDLVWAQVLSDPFLRRLILRLVISFSKLKKGAAAYSPYDKDTLCFFAAFYGYCGAQDRFCSDNLSIHDPPPNFAICPD
ncbi:hypothetical protein Dimus_017820 [Dionaea muscipula]